MKLQRFNKVIAGLTLVLSLVFASAILVPSTAQAQDRRWQWERNNRRDDNYRDRDWYRRQQIERARAIQRAREIERAREWERARARSRYGYGDYGNYGGYGSSASAEEQRGFRNGLKEGRDDAKDRDGFNPNRHSSFRDGNPAYRAGFRQGYEQGFREYASYRRW